MIPPTYQMRPLLCTWADTRPFAGTDAGGCGVWAPGVWGSWSEALQNCFSSAPTNNFSWAWRSNLRGVSRWGASYSTSPGTIPTSLQPQIRYRDNASSQIFLCDEVAICPSRALRADPVPIDVVGGGVQVTLGGITYRNTHSRRRQWSVDLLLDGALDVAAGAGGITTSAPDAWQKFLQYAELGVTLYLYSAEWNHVGQIGPVWAYGGAPNRISGALVDATSLKWSPPQTGILSRYEVTITIAEVSAPGLLS